MRHAEPRPAWLITACQHLKVTLPVSPVRRLHTGAAKQQKADTGAASVSEVSTLQENLPVIKMHRSTVMKPLCSRRDRDRSGSRPFSFLFKARLQILWHFPRIKIKKSKQCSQWPWLTRLSSTRPDGAIVGWENSTSACGTWGRHIMRKMIDILHAAFQTFLSVQPCSNRVVPISRHSLDRGSIKQGSQTCSTRGVRSASANTNHC